MLENGLIVTVGIVLLLWRKWLSRYMRSVKQKAASKDDTVREEVLLFEGALQSPGVSWMIKILPLLGYVMVFYGVISLIFGSR